MKAMVNETLVYDLDTEAIDTIYGRINLPGVIRFPDAKETGIACLVLWGIIQLSKVTPGQ